jgi:hypothetical protein
MKKYDYSLTAVIQTILQIPCIDETINNNVITPSRHEYRHITYVCMVLAKYADVKC